MDCRVETTIVMQENRRALVSHPETDQRDLLYLDDLTVGDVFDSGSYTLDEASIVRFASEFDPQYFHTDADAAKNSVFGGLAASGWHTAGITMRLLVTGGAHIAGGLVGVGAQLSWPKPTRPGDTLRVHSEITEIVPSRSRPDRGIVTMKSETRNQDGDIVQLLLATMIVPRRPTAVTRTPSG